jgi:hypothetical protein
MRVRHTVAAALAGILLIQSAVAAQAITGQEVRTISRDQAVHVLLANLQVGADVRLDLANGDRVEGRLIEKSDEELIVLHGGQRLIVAAADVVGGRVPIKPGMTGGNAFGIGSAIGFGAIFGWFLVLLSGYR